MLKALILCGGFGTRLQPLTKNTPKPLMTIGKKTVIEHIVDRLYLYGITEIIIKVHYLPDKIIEKLGDRVLYYYEPALFSHTETLIRLKKWLQDDEFMVINGDTLSEIDYSDMIKNHKNGTITHFMDSEYRGGGTWIYSSDWFDNKMIPIDPYRPNKIFYDIGTIEKLDAARKHFE